MHIRGGPSHSKPLWYGGGDQLEAGQGAGRLWDSRRTSRPFHMARSISGTTSLASERYRRTFLRLPCVCSSRDEFSVLPHYPDPTCTCAPSKRCLGDSGVPCPVECQRRKILTPSIECVHDSFLGLSSQSEQERCESRCHGASEKGIDDHRLETQIDDVSRGGFYTWGSWLLSWWSSCVLSVSSQDLEHRRAECSINDGWIDGRLAT